MWGQVAIANQTQGQVEQGNPTSLLVENLVSGVEVKPVHEGICSAAPVPSAEKWSHEAIVARSNMRPVRREKLNRAANSAQNPGFDSVTLFAMATTFRYWQVKTQGWCVRFALNGTQKVLYGNDCWK